MDYELAGAVILSGITIVFAVLVLLTLILMVAGKLMTSIGKKGGPVEKAQEQPAAPPVQKPTVQPAVEDGISEETVAVISASLAVVLGSRFAVRGVKRACGHGSKGRRTAWGMAGMQQNTNPF